jgi:transposase
VGVAKVDKFVGIDVSKTMLDLMVRPTGTRQQQANDEDGIAQLIKQLRKIHPALVVCEATGGWERLLVGALAAARLPIVVVNPRQVRDFAKATGRLAKTDRLDAEVIARFAEAVRPEPRALPSADAEALDDLVTRRQQLIDMRTAEGNGGGWLQADGANSWTSISPGSTASSRNSIRNWMTRSQQPGVARASQCVAQCQGCRADPDGNAPQS